MPPFHFEKREFIRVRFEVPVRYKFLSKEIVDPEMEKIHEGTTNNLSGGGLLLTGKVPNMAWLPQLLMNKIFIGINLHLPEIENPIKVLTWVVWIETIAETASRIHMGLRFKELTSQDKDKIFQFIIKSQITT